LKKTDQKVPLERRLCWRVFSALRWSVSGKGKDDLREELAALSQEDLGQVLSLFHRVPMQFCQFVTLLWGAEAMERMMLDGIRHAKMAHQFWVEVYQDRPEETVSPDWWRAPECWRPPQDPRNVRDARLQREERANNRNWGSERIDVQAFLTNPEVSEEAKERVRQAGLMTSASATGIDTNPTVTEIGESYRRMQARILIEQMSRNKGG
jgi:hypothetical protein